MTGWNILMLLSAALMGFYFSGRLVYRHGHQKGGVVLHFLFIVTGLVFTGVNLVLLVIAMWPPVEPMTFSLPFVFLILLGGLVYFIRSTHPRNCALGRRHAA